MILQMNLTSDNIPTTKSTYKANQQKTPHPKKSQRYLPSHLSNSLTKPHPTHTPETNAPESALARKSPRAALAQKQPALEAAGRDG